MQIILENKARKNLKKLYKADKKLHNKIIETIEKYAENPQGNFDVSFLSGKENFRRMRIGSYRIVFEFIENTMVIYNLDKRGNIYKDL